MSGQRKNCEALTANALSASTKIAAFRFKEEAGVQSTIESVAMNGSVYA